MTRKLLTLDTTQPDLMLALYDEGRMLAQSQAPQRLHDSQQNPLFPTLEAALTQAGWVLKDLTDVAVNIGPGSFTGLRSGLTVVKTLAQFHPVRVYGIESFRLLALSWVMAQAQNLPRSVTVMLNAFRGQHYRAAMRVLPEGTITVLEAPHVAENTALSLIETEVVLVGQDLDTKLAFDASITVEWVTSRDTTTAMVKLVETHPESYLAQFEALQPLYLQDPNITLKAKP